MGEALGELPCPAYRGFWCDGVLMNQTESHYSKKYINDKRKARFRTWIGKNGQSPYDLYLTFGTEGPEPLCAGPGHQWLYAWQRNRLLH